MCSIQSRWTLQLHRTTGGIILTNAAVEAEYSFFFALLFTSLVCFGIKLCAVVIQQKIFGGMLGNRTWVRAFVGVNSEYSSHHAQQSTNNKLQQSQQQSQPTLPNCGSKQNTDNVHMLRSGTPIRAIRLILSKPGMSLKKISILCGGPDWPTSVLTGILKLRVLSMLWGSVPV